jgi:hypothetical protein
MASMETVSMGSRPARSTTAGESAPTLDQEMRRGANHGVDAGTSGPGALLGDDQGPYTGMERDDRGFN